MKSLEGKAIVITGAGRGIGAATAKLAADLGARIVINDLDKDEATSVAAAIRNAGGLGVAHPADISQWRDAQGLIDRCVSEWGRIDGLFNNAGYFRMARLDELQEDHLQQH